MAAVRKERKPPSIRTIWAIAKSPELGLSEDDLHALVYRETGKESLRSLTQGEIATVARVLQNMKDGTQRDTRSKRTDEGGDSRTENQRHKIYALCDVLGWNDDHRRINAFVKRICGAERIEWLSMTQCAKVIEALKSMVARQEKQHAAEQANGKPVGG